MEFRLKSGTQGHIYFPKILRNNFGKTLVLVPNSKAGVIFPDGTSPSQVIASLEIIIRELRLREKETLPMGEVVYGRRICDD